VSAANSRTNGSALAAGRAQLLAGNVQLARRLRQHAQAHALLELIGKDVLQLVLIGFTQKWHWPLPYLSGSNEKTNRARNGRLRLVGRQGRQTFSHAVREYFAHHLIESAARRQQLGHDLLAWLPLVEHALHGAYLPFGAAQAVLEASVEDGSLIRLSNRGACWTHV
jgi:hypothetical protein